MLKFAITTLVLVFTQALVAAELRLQSTYNVQAERPHQFRAVLIDDNGSSTEVSGQATFTATGARRSGAPGGFVFSLPSFGSSTSGYETVEVSYNHEGTLLRDRQSVRVDYTPDYIRITGSTYVRSGSSTYLRATGHFGGRSVDLTSRGRWSASYGSIFNGNYRAPTLRQGENSRYDRVSFSFGLRQDSVSVTIRP